MSATSSACWASRSSLGVSRARWRDALALLVLVNAGLWSVPLLLPVLLLASATSIALCVLECVRLPKPDHLDYSPERVLLTLDNGAVWQANLPVAHGCLYDRLALKGECRGKTHWLVLYRDQMPRRHWRRLQVLVRLR